MTLNLFNSTPLRPPCWRCLRHTRMGWSDASTHPSPSPRDLSSLYGFINAWLGELKIDSTAASLLGSRRRKCLFSCCVTTNKVRGKETQNRWISSRSTKKEHDSCLFTKNRPRRDWHTRNEVGAVKMMVFISNGTWGLDKAREM